MAVAIKVENLSKAYQLGEIGTGTLSRDLERWFAKVRGKEDPFLKIGETNDRTSKGNSDVVWSLKDINFEIQQGDAVGIIGRNGAGKSTLLKLLSRVTSPTTGIIKVKGRIASLLEVGTGFHPELTGRENIYLNGAILGMRKKEIARKFDEIVDFAGVERYIDTPVKRYSSGMYVRLAFAVAAHLESEILIVDEVLAVGDAEFQKKCLGKMNDVSKGEGRTVLFVSHNMGAVKNLCSTGIYLKNGRVSFLGKIEDAIGSYMNDSLKNSKTNIKEITERSGTGKIRITDIVSTNSAGERTNSFLCGDKIMLQIYFENHANIGKVKGRFDIGINNQMDDRVAWLSTSMHNETIDFSIGRLTFEIKRISIIPGSYTLNLYCMIDDEVVDWLGNIYYFDIEESDFYNSGKTIPRGQGYLFLEYTTH